MKELIIRADDVGYTQVHNIGTFESIDNGVVTAADIMLDTPGTVEALEQLRKRPWISVGWHAHFWGSPVLGAEKVPSMYDVSRSGFRKDLNTAEDVVFEEALAECRAEMDLCVKILGKAPDMSGFDSGDSPLGRSMTQVMEEYGIVHHCITPLQSSGSYAVAGRKVDPKWEGKIYGTSARPYSALNTDSLTEIEKYDPIEYYLSGGDLELVPDGAAAMHAWHPGYVDYYVYRLGDYDPKARNYIQIRTVDVHALTSDAVKNWIKENGIELVNFRDALYGTKDYQNYLKSIGSNLAVR